MYVYRQVLSSRSEKKQNFSFEFSFFFFHIRFLYAVYMYGFHLSMKKYFFSSVSFILTLDKTSFLSIILEINKTDIELCTKQRYNMYFPYESILQYIFLAQMGIMQVLSNAILYFLDTSCSPIQLALATPIFF